MTITRVGSVTEVSINGTQPPSLAIPGDVTLALDDVVVAQFTGQSTVEAADWTNDAGMTRRGAPFVASSATVRILGTWAVKIDAGNIAMTAVQFTRAGAGTRIVGRLFVLRGVDPTTMIDAATAAANTTGTNTATADSVTPDVGGYAVAQYGSNWSSPQDSAVTVVPSGMTIVGTAKQNPDPGSSAVSRTQSVAYEATVPAGATGAKTVTWAGTTAQRAGELVVFQAAADPPPVGDAVPYLWTGTEWVGPLTIEHVT